MTQLSWWTCVQALLVICLSVSASRCRYSQLLQEFQFALDLSGSVSVVAESVNKDLKHRRDDGQDGSCTTRVLRPRGWLRLAAR